MTPIQDVLFSHGCVMSNVTDECMGCQCFTKDETITDHISHSMHVLRLIREADAEARAYTVTRNDQEVRAMAQVVVDLGWQRRGAFPTPAELDVMLAVRDEMVKRGWQPPDVTH